MPLSQFKTWLWWYPSNHHLPLVRGAVTADRWPNANDASGLPLYILWGYFVQIRVRRYSSPLGYQTCQAKRDYKSTCSNFIIEIGEFWLIVSVHYLLRCHCGMISFHVSPRVDDHAQNNRRDSTTRDHDIKQRLGTWIFRQQGNVKIVRVWRVRLITYVNGLPECAVFTARSTGRVHCPRGRKIEETGRVLFLKSQ